MLTRAAQRLRSSGPGSARIVFLQAELFDLPFRPRSFPTVAYFGLLHLFDDLVATLAALHGQLATDGSLYVTSLVGETAVGSRALALLHRAGEAAPPRTESDVLATARTVLGDTISGRRRSRVGISPPGHGEVLFDAVRQPERRYVCNRCRNPDADLCSMGVVPNIHKDPEMLPLHA